MPSDEPPHYEIERKYLLRALPPRARSAPFEDLWQGWIPGEKLQERLRRTKGARGLRYFRTVKLGRGISRIEVEEQTDPALFRRMWPLTAGKRVRKRRYLVEEGALLWEIDAFADRELFLAEVELPSADTPVSLPDWLSPFVVREVTGEDEFVNINLAR
jgi:adenylate cyclase